MSFNLVLLPENLHKKVKVMLTTLAMHMEEGANGTNFLRNDFAVMSEVPYGRPYCCAYGAAWLHNKNWKELSPEGLRSLIHSMNGEDTIPFRRFLTELFGDDADLFRELVVRYGKDASYSYEHLSLWITRYNDSTSLRMPEMEPDPRLTIARRLREFAATPQELYIFSDGAYARK